MGCQSSKPTPKSKQVETKPGVNGATPQRNEAANNAETGFSNSPAMGASPYETGGISAPEGRASAAGFPTSEGAPSREPTRPNTATAEVDEHGEQIELPKGSWIRAEGTPYYYSAMENLFYHPPSRQFYDPNNGMWYDSDTNEWYRDEDDDIESHPTQHPVYV